MPSMLSRYKVWNLYRLSQIPHCSIYEINTECIVAHQNTIENNLQVIILKILISFQDLIFFSKSILVRPLSYIRELLLECLKPKCISVIYLTINKHILVEIKKKSNFIACFRFDWFDSLRPINNLSVKQGRVFLGWTSTKLG